MCLDLKKNSRLQKANHDITVYKLIKIKDGVNYTFFKGFEFEIGKTYGSALECGLLNNWWDGKICEIGLHSFGTLREARDYRESMIFDWLLSDLGFTLYFVKCVIPKGSTYYRGLFEGHDSYASDKLTYVEFVK